MTEPNRPVVEILLTPETVRERLAELGREVSDAYRGSLPLLVGVLKGCSLFMADLVRNMDIPLEMDFMAVAGYGDGLQRASGAVRITKDLDSVIEGRDVLLVAGLVDTGMTVGYLMRNLEVRQPRSLRLCTFLDKQTRRIIRVPIAFRGFTVPDRFVVGYGLDFRQLYRNLPYVGVLDNKATGLERPYGPA